MRVLRPLVASILVCLAATTTSAWAQSPDTVVPAEEKPSPESIRHLLKIMQGDKIVQAMTEQLDSTFTGVLNKQLEGHDLTAEQRDAIAARHKAAMDMIHELLSPQSMESLYLKVYSETFTQSEIDGMTDFYASPAGQAVIAKMPMAVKNTMTEMHGRMQEMIPKLQQMAKETADQIKSQPASKKSG
jgi:uncharacterized protein